MTMRWAGRRLRDVIRDSRGAVTVESVLIMTFVLLPLFIAVVDLSRAIRVSAMLDDAVHAAMLSAVHAGANAAEPEDIRQAAYAAVGAQDFSMNMNESCLCVPGQAQGNPVEVACHATCGAMGNPHVSPETHLEIMVEQPFAPILPYPFLSDSPTISSAATVRWE